MYGLYPSETSRLVTNGVLLGCLLCVCNCVCLCGLLVFLCAGLFVNSFHVKPKNIKIGIINFRFKHLL